MAVKKKSLKKLKSKHMLEDSVMIRCCHCTIKADCKIKESKIKTEKMGIQTYCSVTPDKPLNPNKRKQRYKKNRVAN